MYTGIAGSVRIRFFVCDNLNGWKQIGSSPVKATKWQGFEYKYGSNSGTGG